MIKLYFVRHGQTLANVEHRFSGQTESSLTDQGIAQAQESGKELRELVSKIDLIISSPYERTLQTAIYIAKEIDYPVNQIITHPLFVERHLGILEGQKADHLLTPGRHMRLDHIEGVETIEQLHERASSALSYLKKLDEYENVLVVSHGTFGRALRRVVLKYPHTQENEIFAPIGNAEILELI